MVWLMVPREQFKRSAKNGQALPSLPVAVTVQFDHKSDPLSLMAQYPLHHIVGLAHSLAAPVLAAASRAVTIHTSYGLALDQMVLNIGKKAFCARLTFAAISRVRRITDLLLLPLFAFQ